MHPLTTVVTGLYNKKLPNQNGAPLEFFFHGNMVLKVQKLLLKLN